MLQSLDFVVQNNELQIYYRKIDFKLLYNKDHLLFLKSLSKKKKWVEPFPFL